MANLKVEKVNALPGTLAANTLYIVTDADSNYAKLYISNSAGTAARRLPTKDDINTMIAAGGGGGGGITVLEATDAPTISSTVTELAAGVISGAPQIFFVNSAAASNEKIWQWRATAAGDLELNLFNDAMNTNPTVVTMQRSGIGLALLGITATNVSITGALTATTLSGNGASITSLNATYLSSGTVNPARMGSGTPDSTTFLRGDGAWVKSTLPRTTAFNAAAIGTRIAITSGQTIPANTYAAGDAFSFYNDSASNLTLTQGAGLTLRLDGTTLTGNRTLAARGTCFVWFNSATEAIVSGSVT